MKKGVVHSPQKTKKSRLQVRYEKLLLDIKQNKELQVTLEEGMQKVLPMIQQEIRPLLDEKRSWFKKRLMRLDELADEIGVGKYNREWFDEYMAEESMALMNDLGTGDVELRGIFQKYSGESPDPDQSELQQVADIVKETFGFDFDVEEAMKQGMDNYMNSNMEEFRAKIIEKQEKEEQDELDNFDPNATQKQSKEDTLLAQDAKAIYMRLIKKFHPDLEQDELRKLEKTKLVQQVTKAYKDNDFLELLNLQIEHLDEQENEGNALAEDMLKRYNKILKKQLDEIQQEIAYIKQSSMGLYEDFFDKNSKFSLRRFNTYKKDLKKEIESLESEMRDAAKRKKGWFKEWMKYIKDYRMEEMMQNAFMNIFQNSDFR